METAENDPPRVYAQPIRLTFTPDVLRALDRIIEVYNAGQRTIRRGGDGLYTRSSLLRELVMLEAARLVRDGRLAAPLPPSQSDATPQEDEPCAP